jgi:hypothetical protein
MEQQARLRLRTDIQSDGSLFAGVTDDLGEEAGRLRTRSPASGWSHLTLPPTDQWRSRALDIRCPVALPRMLVGCAERLDWRRVPVFAAAPPAFGSGVEVAERLLRTMLESAMMRGEVASVSLASLGAARWVVLQDRVTPREAFAPAIQLARHHIVIGKGDPRGFAFSAFGPAELSLVQG